VISTRDPLVQAYLIEQGTVEEDKTYVREEVLDTLVVVEVNLGQLATDSVEVHRVQYNLVVVRHRLADGLVKERAVRVTKDF